MNISRVLSYGIVLFCASHCVMAQQIAIAVQTLPSTALQITDRTGKPADGIVCDNLHDTQATDRDELRITVDPAYATANVTCDAYDADGVTQMDRHLQSNAGSTEPGIGGFTYIPPDELNFEQKPRPGNLSDLTREATRTIILKAHLTMQNGTRYDVTDRPITIARAPIVLIHGVNTSPSYWKPFIRSVSSSVQVPIVAVNHRDPKNYNGDDYRTIAGGLFRGNGPVEVGAYLLEQRIQETLTQVRTGQMITDADQNTGSEINSSNLYTGKKLAIRRVDVVAWSYGGLIARWYVTPKPPVASQTPGWYQRPGGYTLSRPTGSPIDFTKSLPSVTYAGDIRKIITLGSMWRGVPLVNYLNEALFPAIGTVHLSEAPIGLLWVTQYHTVGALIESLPIPTQAPAMEVMAVNSPWLSHLDLASAPFMPEIAYGSVAGDRNEYIPIPYVGRTVDPYTTIDLLQKPSWFPYLTLERRLSSERNFTDGLVPIWSAAIPGSNIIVPVVHNNLPDDAETQTYVLLSLNSAALPTGTSLNVLWNRSISSFDKTQIWTFHQGKMAPDPQNDLYQQVGGVGRLATNAVHPYARGFSVLTDPQTLDDIRANASAAAQKAGDAVKGAVTQGGQILAPLANMLPAWMKP